MSDTTHRDVAGPGPEDTGGPSQILRTLVLLPWGAVAAVLLWGVAEGDRTLAGFAAAALLLAVLPRGFTAVSGIAFPAGLKTGILLFGVAALLAGEWGGLYVSTAWWDVMLHLVSAATLAVVGMALAMIATGGARPHLAVWVTAVVAFGFAMMVGAMWELMEFSLDALLGTQTQRSGLPDTMGDQLANLCGALYGALAAGACIGRGARWPLGGLLARFMAANPILYPRLPSVLRSDEARRRQP